MFYFPQLCRDPQELPTSVYPSSYPCRPWQPEILSPLTGPESWELEKEHEGREPAFCRSQSKARQRDTTLAGRAGACQQVPTHFSFPKYHKGMMHPEHNEPRPLTCQPRAVAVCHRGSEIIVLFKPM